MNLNHDALCLLYGNLNLISEMKLSFLNIKSVNRDAFRGILNYIIILI
jgi:hypothetical protein